MVMQIIATVNKSDYENALSRYWEKEDIDADLEVDGVLYPGGEIAFRGTTSLNYPKKGFKVKFRKKELYQGHTKRFDLSASYTDKSLIRERLCFDLFADADVFASKAWHIDFTIRSKTGEMLQQGLYTGLEHVDKYFFANQNRQVGTLYKADGGIINGQFMGAVLDPQQDAILQILYDKEYTKKVTATGFWANLAQFALKWPYIQIADADDEDYSDLVRLIQEINAYEAIDIHQHLGTIFDVDSYLNWLAVNTVVQSNDTYHKNYFLHNRVEDDKWEIMPWDYDLTFGRNWNTYCNGLCDDLSEGTSIKGPNQMLNQLSSRVLNNPQYFEQLRAKLIDLLETAFTEDKLYPQIDSLYQSITPAAHADITKWPTNQEFDQERHRLKDWIRRRRAFLYREFDALPDSAPRPDTIIEQLGFDKAAPAAGDSIAFEATVKNIGAAPAGPTVGVAFLINGEYITFGTTDLLQPGASKQIKSVSTWEATPGDYTLTAVVDDVNRYPEISEENNTLELGFHVKTPSTQGLSDVVVKDCAFERMPDGRVRLAALVSNIGRSRTADVVGVAFLVDDRYACFGVVSPMEAGQEQAVRAQQTVSLAGTHKITAIADDVNRFAEEQELNNQLIKQIDFGGTQPKQADVTIIDVRMGQGRFAEGDEIIFETLVKNVGLAATGSVVGVAFLIDGQYITFGTTAAIEPGQIATVSAVSAWRATTGNHQLIAIADDVNRFPEQSEENNRFVLAFEVFDQTTTDLPDSTVDEIGFEPQDTGQIILTATVSNIGQAVTPDVVGAAFFVDDKYTTFGVTKPMSPGTTANIRAVAPVTLYGTHKITAIVDDVNRYSEISHQNNSLTRHITVTTTERRAIWITRFDWTDLNQVPAPERIDQMVENIAAAGFNTIFFQVRAAGQAWYTPGLEPWAARLTGSAWQTMGSDPHWDPLARMLDKAHAAGLHVHAYINAYTFWLAPPNEHYGELAPGATQPIHIFDRLTYGPRHANHPGEYGLGWAWRHHANGDSPMNLDWGKHIWASPGVDQVQDHISAVAIDLVQRYAVDGLHLDHIRYAGPQYSFDPASNAIAGTGKTPARDQWQRDRVTALVSRIYQQTKAIRPALCVSAAVWPYYQDKWGWNVQDGYTHYFQDSKGWLSAGNVDAIVPMLYDSKADDFLVWQTLLNDFLADSGGKHIYPGIGGFYDNFAEIANRIDATRQAAAAGHAIFSYGALNERNYWELLAAGPYSTPALVPLSAI